MVYYPQVQNRMAAWAPAPNRRILGQTPFIDLDKKQGRQKTIQASLAIGMVGAAVYAFSEMVMAPKKRLPTKIAMGTIGAGLAMAGLLSLRESFD